MRTTLLIRPAARGGKYLGHDAANASNQSAIVAILDISTDKIIAIGVSNAPDKASAGPANLMAPVGRNEPFAADGQTVQVQLSVDIKVPTDFRIMVVGPLSFPDQSRAAQADITVLPGVNVGMESPTSEGLVLEIPGLCISGVQATFSEKTVTCFAKVTMMCGCPIQADPKWYWPAQDFSVQLVTLMASGKAYYYDLKFDNDPTLISSFTGSWANQASVGDYIVEAWVYASEPKLGNQGCYKIPDYGGAQKQPEWQRRLLEAAGIH
jgi:hypothetical protein